MGKPSQIRFLRACTIKQLKYEYFLVDNCAYIRYGSDHGYVMPLVAVNPWLMADGSISGVALFLFLCTMYSVKLTGHINGAMIITKTYARILPRSKEKFNENE